MHLGDKYTSYLTNTPAVREEISPTPAFNPYLGRNPCKENQRNSYFCSINEYDTSMFRLLWLYIALLLPALLTNAQELSRDTLPGNPLTLDGKPMTEKQIERYLKQARKDSIRAKKRIWWSILGGPSYTPEASFGVGGAVMASFRLDKNDTISQRSFIPAGFNITLNGTFVFAGAGTLFFNENRFRIYINYSYRNEPSHYFGKGYETIEHIERSDSTTKFHKSAFQLYPRFVWEVKPHLYAGPLFDINFSKSSDINPVMAADPYFSKFKRSYVNIGVGGLIQYDTRDDVATPHAGMLLSAIAKLYGKYLGGSYNYEIFELEYRQYQPVFRPRSTLAWITKTQIGVGDVPFTELPYFGSPFDLRGYYLGKYRDKSMAYGIVEYRHMFGSEEKYRSGNFWAKCGFVAWVGTGTIGNAPIVDWSKWKFNYGVGLRFQIQPGKNFRLDIGKDPSQKGMAVYMNMTEAF